MLAIIISILKIIGIVLLWILGAVAVIILIILFFPVTYHGTVRRTEAEGDPPVTAGFRASWLFGFLRAAADYPGTPYLCVKLLWIELMRLPDDGVHAGRVKGLHKKKKKHKKAQTGIRGDDTADREPDDKKPDQKTDRGPEQEKEKRDAAPDQGEHISGGRAASENRSEEENSEGGSIGKLVQTVRKFADRIIYTIRKIYDKIKNSAGKTEEINSNIKYYADIINSEEFRKTFGDCKKQVLRILHQLLPRHFRAEIIEGTGDPAGTAQILAIFGIMYPLIGRYVDIMGDFDDTTIKADVVFRGRITVFMLIYAGCRLYFNKDVRKLIKQFKKEE
jgi:hypothetical protein